MTLETPAQITQEQLFIDDFLNKWRQKFQINSQSIEIEDRDYIHNLISKTQWEQDKSCNWTITIPEVEIKKPFIGNVPYQIAIPNDSGLWFKTKGLYELVDISLGLVQPKNILGRSETSIGMGYEWNNLFWAGVFTHRYRSTNNIERMIHTERLRIAQKLPGVIAVPIFSTENFIFSEAICRKELSYDELRTEEYRNYILELLRTRIKLINKDMWDSKVSIDTNEWNIREGVSKNNKLSSKRYINFDPVC